MTWRKVVQLAMVHVGVSITVVPVTSTLNRIMIADMGFPAILVSILIALPYLLSPIQVAIGNWADNYPIWGQYRSPWIVIGGLLASFGSYFTAHTVYWMDSSFVPGLVMAVLAFTAWGLGVNMASVSYLSLVSEMSGDADAWRSRAVSSMWVMMILSTILVSIGLSRMLDPFSREALITGFGVVWAIASFLILLGSANLETRAAIAVTERRNNSTNPVVAFRLLTINPSARRFFCYLLLVLVSIHAQDVLLEPFGGEVLNMAVAQTSRLTAIWGIGVMLTLIGGTYLIRHSGKKRSANIGAAIAALAFLLIVWSGYTKVVFFLQSSVFLLGLGGGLMTISNLSFMLEMTVPEAAGLYIGAWGVANFVGQALGNLLSGLIRDLVFMLSDNVAAGYTIVFGLETLGLVIAIILFRSITVKQFQQDAEFGQAQLMTASGM